MNNPTVIEKNVLTALQNLTQHPFTSIQLTDKEKFHTGMLKLLLEFCAKSSNPKLQNHGLWSGSELINQENSSYELEKNSIDLFAQEAGATVLIESKFKTGINFTKQKNDWVKQIQKYTNNNPEAKAGIVVSLFPESGNLAVDGAKHFKSFSNITYTKEVLELLDRVIEESKKNVTSSNDSINASDELGLFKLWRKYLVNLKVIVEYFIVKQMEEINIPNLDRLLYEIKLKGIFQRYRMGLVQLLVDDWLPNKNNSLYRNIQNSLLPEDNKIGSLGNTHGNSYLHYPISIINEHVESYGIQWQGSKLKLFIKVRNWDKFKAAFNVGKGSDDPRIEILEELSLLITEGEQLPKDIKREGKFMSRNIAIIHEFEDDLNEVPARFIKYLMAINQNESIIQKRFS